MGNVANYSFGKKTFAWPIYCQLWIGNSVVTFRHQCTPAVVSPFRCVRQPRDGTISLRAGANQYFAIRRRLRLRGWSDKKIALALALRSASSSLYSVLKVAPTAMQTAFLRFHAAVA